MYRVAAPTEDQQAMCRGCGRAFVIAAAKLGCPQPVRRTSEQAAAEYYFGESLVSRIDSVDRGDEVAMRPTLLRTIRGRSLASVSAIAVLMAFAWAFAALRASENPGGGRDPELRPQTVAELTPAKSGYALGELADFIESVEPSVVQVRTTRSIGSGFVIDPRGLIATCWHCVDDVTNASVVLADGSTLPVVGVRARRPQCDLAILEVSPDDHLKPLALANEPPRKGERVVVFGSPVGLSFSVSEGRISAVRTMREVRQVARHLRGGGRLKLAHDCDVIQFAAISMPGHSGGPILDRRGNVLGVISFGLPYQGHSFEFAISYTEIAEIASDLDAVATPLAELRRQALEG
ncbi:MAG: serine protease [Planctomycetota bacterium]